MAGRTPGRHPKRRRPTYEGPPQFTNAKVGPRERKFFDFVARWCILTEGSNYSIFRSYFECVGLSRTTTTAGSRSRAIGAASGEFWTGGWLTIA